MRGLIFGLAVAAVLATSTDAQAFGRKSKGGCGSSQPAFTSGGFVRSSCGGFGFSGFVGQSAPASVGECSATGCPVVIGEFQQPSYTYSQPIQNGVVMSQPVVQGQPVTSAYPGQQPLTIQSQGNIPSGNYYIEAGIQPGSFILWPITPSPAK